MTKGSRGGPLGGRQRQTPSGASYGVQVMVAVSLGVPPEKTSEAFEHTGKLPESDELESAVGQLGFCA